MSHLDEGTLHAHLDGELSAEEVAQLQEHLATCADCRARLDVARATRTRAHEILRYADPQGIVPPDFATRVSGRSVTSAPRTRRRAVGALILPWAASLLLALGVGWYAQELLRGGGRGGEMERMAAAESEISESATPAPAATPAPEMDRSAAATYTAGDEVTRTALPPVDAGRAGGDAARPAEAGAASTAEETQESPAIGNAQRMAAVAAPEQTRASAPAGAAAPRGAPDLATADRGGDAVQAGEAIVVTGAVRPEAQTRVRPLANVSAETAGAVPPPAPALPAPPAAAMVRTRQAAAASAAWAMVWVPADRAAAARLLGTAPVTIGSLEVESYAVAADGSAAVRVVQRLPGGEPLEILQRRIAAAPAEGIREETAQAPRTEAGAGAAGEAAALNGAVEIVLRAAVPADSLERLKEAVR